MKITYLIRNDKVKNQLLHKKLPKGVARSTVGTYEAEGGRLFLLSFTVDGSTIAGARKLAKLRDELQDDANTRLLVDDASLKFARALYPRFAEYERKLRCAITLATCAKYDNFDDPLVKSLENLPLKKLEERLFCDKSFQDKIRNLTKKTDFTKNDVTDLLSRSNETTVWSALFGGEDLSSVRENFRQLREMRNGVMHQRLITEGNYDRARKMLRTSIHELDTYIEKVRSYVMSYLERQAARAASAAKLLRDNDNYEYASIFEQLAVIVSRLAVVQDPQNPQNPQNLMNLVNATRELRESVFKASEIIGSIGKLQTPAVVSTFEDMKQWTTALQTTVSTIGSSALSSPRQMDSSSTDGSDNDLGDVSDDDGKTGSDEK